MQMFNAYVEVDHQGVFDVDEVLDALPSLHAALEHSSRGYAAARITLAASSLAQAATIAVAVVSQAYGRAAPIVVEVMTQEEFMNRQGWRERHSTLVSVTEAAEMLGVTRQAVLQLIESESLPAEKVGPEYLLPRAAVEAIDRV